ncbi:MAG: hypothetical protein ACXW00_03955 [Methylobacter sp.]
MIASTSATLCAGRLSQITLKRIGPKLRAQIRLEGLVIHCLIHTLGRGNPVGPQAGHKSLG